MWGDVGELLGGDYDEERLAAVDFWRAAINAFAAMFQKSEVPG